MKWAATSVTALLLVLLFPVIVAAQDTGGGVVLVTSYPSVVADKGKQITFSIEVVNRSQSYQEVDLQLADGPMDWQPVLKDRGFIIRKVQVAPGKSQILDFQATPPADAPAKDYSFLIKAIGPGGAVLSDLHLGVTLQDKVGAALRLSTQYPTLRGQAGNTFSFKMDVNNDATEDRTINLSAVAPQGWEVNFKPAYESKQVSSVRVKAGSSQGIDIDVVSPQRVATGEYPINVQATAGNDKAEVTFKVVIIGNYKVSLTTASGQLNARAEVDRESPVSLQVKNNGTADLQNITFSASKPEGWQVTFSPEKIDSLPAGQTAEVTANIKPASRALAGDYMVSVTASAGQTSDSKDLRVSVETPTTWGWIGVAVILLVLGGLGVLFTQLSRR